jgi:hypothetical protein
MKLRKQHRGRRVDIGSSFEIQLFGGMFRLIEENSSQLVPHFGFSIFAKTWKLKHASLMKVLQVLSLLN